MFKFLLSAAGIALLSSPVIASIVFNFGLILYALKIKIGRDICVIISVCFIIVCIIKGCM